MCSNAWRLVQPFLLIAAAATPAAVPVEPLDRVEAGGGVGQEALGHRLAGDQEVAVSLVGQGPEGDAERQRLVAAVDVGGELCRSVTGWMSAG